MARASQNDFNDGFSLVMFVLMMGTFATLWLGWYFIVPALVLTVGWGGYSFYRTGRALPAPEVIPELEVVHDPDFGIFAGYVCPTWEHNRLERALDGTDFIPCDNIECGSCYPNGKCAVADCNLPGIIEWWNAFYHASTEPEWLCNSHFTIRDEERDKVKARKEEFRQTRMLQEKAEAERLEASRMVKVEGVMVRRPDVVPEYANAKWYRRTDYLEPMNYIVWKWIDPHTGKEMFTKSYHPETWDIKAEYKDMYVGPDEPQGIRAWDGTWIPSEYQKPRRKENKQITNVWEAGKKPKAIAKKAPRIGTEKGWKA